MVKTQQQETEMEKVLYETFLACKTAEDVKALLGFVHVFRFHADGATGESGAAFKSG